MSYKASLIISVYDNIPFLRAVLDSLAYQTETNFEVIISEDAEHAELAQFVSSYPFRNDYQHLTQPDEGWRKEKALNNAIRAAKSDYLIFIDGDCVLHPRFIEYHLKMAGEKYILAGKRVKLNARLSDKILDDSKELLKMPSYLAKALFVRDGVRYIEEGFFISPDGPFGWIPKVRTLTHLTGSNMSFYRDAIECINGFDEDYILPAVGEDGDLTWRFNAAGYEHRSVRNLAVQNHLHHKEQWSDQSVNMAMMREKQGRNEYICKNGLKKL